MNLFLKKPDLINGAISMSGVYDLTEYTKGYWDEQVYFNSPIHYIPNLTDSWYLDRIRASHHIHIYTAAGRMKILMLTRDSRRCYGIKEYGTNWISGGLISIMTGLPGGICCRISLITNFNESIYPVSRVFTLIRLLM
jgi:hypothetical protein